MNRAISAGRLKRAVIGQYSNRSPKHGLIRPTNPTAAQSAHGAAHTPPYVYRGLWCAQLCADFVRTLCSTLCNEQQEPDHDQRINPNLVAVTFTRTGDDDHAPRTRAAGDRCLPRCCPIGWSRASTIAMRSSASPAWHSRQSCCCATCWQGGRDHGASPGSACAARGGGPIRNDALSRPTPLFCFHKKPPTEGVSRARARVSDANSSPSSLCASWRPCNRGVAPCYCPVHPRATRKTDDARRGTREERGYDWTWRTKIRPAVLAQEPLCRACSAKGLIVPATQVDHIDGNSRNNNADNLRPLCASCHSSRTARDQSWGRGR